MTLRISYPDMAEDLDREVSEHLADQARQAIDPSDLLAYTTHELLAIADDHESPLWGLIQQCLSHGTYSESGKLPYRCALVGEAFLPLIDRAITKLIQETLDKEWG